MNEPQGQAPSNGSDEGSHRASLADRVQKHWFVGLLCLGVLGAVGLALWVNYRPATDSGEKSFPIPPYSESRYLNTSASAKYVGIETCRECHQGRHQSYLNTAHSRAFAEVDPKAEPPDGEFYHEASKHHYRIYRKDGKLRHEELVKNAEGEVIARVDWPVRYRFGSGNNARTYAIDVEGALQESPVTWYAGRKQWNMSPGYEGAWHFGFERLIPFPCMTCHTGRVESKDVEHRHAVHEMAIGCESCHGPGSHHAELHRTRKVAPGDEDLTIVHPTRLPRDRLEAACAACHLLGAARIFLRGRQANDFRPGMRLTDYWIDYRFDSGSEEMTVVGHVEQMRRSVCYQKNDKLTCTTCHNLHAREAPSDPVAYYRQKCLNCHDEQACRLDKAHRLKKNPADSCAACHMPRGATDVPHVAFTHHRIGVHGAKAAAPGHSRPPQLVPIEDESHLSEIDRKRNLGLAYQMASRSGHFPELAGHFTERAQQLLETAYKEGLRDPACTSVLAALLQSSNPVRSKDLAREALRANHLPGDMRIRNLEVLAELEMRDKDYPAAMIRLHELTAMRTFAQDWSRLAECYLNQQRPNQSLPALHKALSIRPDIPMIHVQLTEVYRQLGDLNRASEHTTTAQRLGQAQPQK